MNTYHRALVERGIAMPRMDLRWADLRGADLGEADLRWADLKGADLSNADLKGGNIDCATWPLWCGSKNVKVDLRLARQLAAHFCALDCDDPEFLKVRAALVDFASKSHRAEELGLREREEAP